MNRTRRQRTERSKWPPVTALLIAILWQSGRFDLLRSDETPATDNSSRQKTAAVIETVPLEITIHDPDGMPVEGVEIAPYGLRAKNNPGSHYSWFPERHGSRAPAITNGDGQATIQVPRFVIERDETSVVSITAKHTSYIELTADVAFQKPGTLTMQRGRRYFVTAIDADSGMPFKTRLFAQLSGQSGLNEWTLDDNGTLSSVAVSPTRALLRAFHVPENGPVMFGEPFEASAVPDDDLECYLPDMLLRPGKQISGRLDDTVPRPVKEGHVVLYATNTVNPFNEANKQLSWVDWTPIRADGTFDFPSVPPDQIVMMLAVCRGYLSASATSEELDAAKIPQSQQESFLVSGQSLPMVTRSDDDVTDFVFPMLPTASVRVKVTTPDGKPLANASVYMSPNQHFPGSGSSIIGDAYSTARIALLTEDQLKQPWWSHENLAAMKAAGVRRNVQNFYSAKTDENGTAELCTLPAGLPDTPVEETITAEHADYQIGDPTTPSSDREVRVKLIRNQTTEVTIQMQSRSNK